MSSHDVRFGGNAIPETVLPPESTDVLDAISAAATAGVAERRDALADLVAANPRSSTAWAALGDAGRDRIESYAAYRVGYHRGLDALRQNGWRGSGFVRGEHASNRGFLECLDGLRRIAAEIGEHDEAERCALFLRQLDPSWPAEVD
jgi:hypothetical protein